MYNFDHHPMKDFEDWHLALGPGITTLTGRGAANWCKQNCGEHGVEWYYEYSQWFFKDQSNWMAFKLVYGV